MTKPIEVDEKGLRAAWSLAIFILLFPAAAWEAWTFLRLWAWYAIPIGAPALTMRTVLGFGVIGHCARLILGMTRVRVPGSDAEEIAKDKQRLSLMTLGPAALLLSGWIFSHC